MTKLAAVLDDLQRRYVRIDCHSTKTGMKWCHLVDEKTADEDAAHIEQRLSGVKVTVRR